MRKVQMLAGTGEGSGEKRGGEPPQFAAVTLRVERDEGLEPKLRLHCELPENDPVRPFLDGIADGIQRQAYAQRVLGGNVTVIAAKVDESESTHKAFAAAAARAFEAAVEKAGLRPIEVDEAAYSRVLVPTRDGSALMRGIAVRASVRPHEDARPLWTTRHWNRLDPAIRERAHAVVARLAGASPPWVDVQLELLGGVEEGKTAGPDALEAAIDAALDACEPEERPRLGPEVLLG